MRFSRAKPTGSFRVYYPSSLRVAAHADTLREARKDAEYWSQQTPNPIEVQERFPSGQWVTVETVVRKFPSATKSTACSKRSHATTATKKTSHATKATKAKAGATDKINIDQLAKLFGLPDWEKIDEMNQQHYWEVAQQGPDNSEAAEEAAEEAAQTEVYGQWYDAVESTASKLFEEHGLELSPTGKQGTKDRRYDFKIVPSTSWDDATNKIRETINGVGDFHFNNLREFLSSGPYTAKQAVLSHLGYIKRYPAVYGGLGAHQMYENAWR